MSKVFRRFDDPPDVVDVEPGQDHRTEDDMHQHDARKRLGTLFLSVPRSRPSTRSA